MKKRENKKGKKKKGFTLIEILIILAIIVILASMIIASIISARNKSRGASALKSMRSVVVQAFPCLTSNLPGARLTNMNSGAVLCAYVSGPAVGYPNWPDISTSGWSSVYVTTNVDGFSWCPVGYAGNLHPSAGAYQDGVRGGSSVTGEFCYMLKSGPMYIWCTEDGCKKEGF
jgi:prepilin-type N-terminal cleavage/methylation domain-containing protein